MWYVKVKMSLKQITLFSFPLKQRTIFLLILPMKLGIREGFYVHYLEKMRLRWLASEIFRPLKERAELVEPDKQILCDRPWTTLFCPIKTLQVEQDPLFANLYVDPASLDDNIATLDCSTPGNDGEFYNKTMRRM